MFKRHIQDFSSAANLQKHWGYDDRVLPCTSDAATCEYLDIIYHSHDLGMFYSAGLWALLLLMLLILIIARWTSYKFRRQTPETPQQLASGPSKLETQDQDPSHQLTPRSSLQRLLSTLSSLRKRLLGPEIPHLHATRMQVAVLAILCTYLLIFTFLGIALKTWHNTPVKMHPGLTQTRSSVGAVADRLGILAFALTPLAILLAARESILSLLTGIPAQHFIFLHIWTGRIIFVQALAHAIMWSVVMGILYQPQPVTYTTWLVKPYMRYGIAAIFFLTLLFAGSFKAVVRRTGYEVFRKTHYLSALAYMGMCWGHWDKLHSWMLASLTLYALDRAARALRLIEPHLGHKDGKTPLGFKPLRASVKVFDDAKGAVIRLDVPRPGNTSWLPSQHFYITFPALSVWQSHPFTVLSIPDEARQYAALSFIIRAEQGETAKLLAWAAARTSDEEIDMVVAGPYGPPDARLSDDANVLGVAAGTGVSYVLPILARAAVKFPRATKKLVWIVRERVDLEWIRRELVLIQGEPWNIDVEVFLTRESSEHRDKEKGATTSSDESTASDGLEGLTITALGHGRPDLQAIVESFIESSASSQAPTRVIGSGPATMMSDLRRAAANCNKPSKVWSAGDERWHVSVQCDTRFS